jgi:hypothetical protein
VNDTSGLFAALQTDKRHTSSAVKY